MLYGSTYASFIYLQNIDFYSNVLLKVALSVAMIIIAYAPKKIKLFLKELVLFYVLSFVFGGCAISLLYFIKPQEIIMKNGVYIGRYPLKIALLAGCVGFAMSVISFKVVKTKITKKNMICDISIEIFNKKINIKAYVDTGNMLKEPISGNPVIVVEKEKLKDIVPVGILEQSEEILNGECNDTKTHEENLEYISRLRLIPFKSIGKQNGMMLGIKSDKVYINFEDEDIWLENTIIGIYNGKLSKNEGYAALIGLELVERRKKYELVTNT